MINNLQLKWKLIIGFAVPLALLIAISTVVYISLNKLLTTNKWVAHTYQAIDIGKGIGSSLVNMETGLRGYLVGGSEDFLEPFNNGKKEFDKIVTETMGKVKDNPTQVDRIKKVISLQNDWQEKHVSIAMTYRKEVNAGVEAAEKFAEISARTVGKEKFDSFRVSIASLEKEIIKSDKGTALVKALLMDMVNQETGQRGYLLSGKEESLEPYEQGQKDFKENSSKLSALIEKTYRLDEANRKFNPSTVGDLLNKASNQANDWRKLAADPEIKARREMNKVTRTIGDISTFIQKGIGKKYMDQMRGVLDEFVKAEAVLIKERDKDQQRISDVTIYITIFGTLTALILGGVVTYLLTRMILRQLGGEPTEAVAIAQEIASGKLKSEGASSSNKRIGLIGDIYQMKDQLYQIITESNGVLSKVNRGDFSSTVEINALGDLELLKNGINNTVLNIKETFGNLNNVMNALSEADFGRKIDFADLDGEYKVCVLSGVDAMKNSGNAITAINSVMSNVADGEFDQRVNISLPGDLGKLKDNINTSLDVIEKGIEDTSKITVSLSKGDLTQRVVANHPGQFGVLKAALNETMENITEVVGNIAEAAEVVSSASTEIADGNSDMSKRTEAQASSLEETASSMEELTSTVKQNAENANQANQLAINASGVADEGRNVVTDAVQAMDEINNSSNKIADIIGVIDEIAFQTNLLALNASVEAARAGEQGRGFAVVATEVRNLAQRSATAAKEIKDLIQDSVGKVKAGSELVAKSGETLSEIVDGVKKVGDMIAEIAAASEQQNAGISQVNQALASMDEITQQNAALAEEASANSENLNSQAITLNDQVQFFSIDNSKKSISKASAPKTASSSGSAPKATPKPKTKAKTSKPEASDDWEEF